jgi:hypothetical protein
MIVLCLSSLQYEDRFADSADSAGSVQVDASAYQREQTMS